MKPGQYHTLKKTVYRLLLLVIPTVLFICFFLKRVNAYYAILGNGWISQTIYFAIGCTVAVFVFRYRFRFFTLSAALALFLAILYQIIQQVSFGEFDSFHAAIRFYVFSVLFLVGWLSGYGFSRSRFVTIFWSSLLLLSEIALISRTSDITVSSLINGLIPVLVYCFYCIYTAELIRNVSEEEARFSFFIGKRLVWFTLLILVFLVGLLTLFKSEFQAVEKQWGGGKAQNKEGNGGSNSESMTQKDKNGGIQNKDQTKLSGSLNKDKSLVFVARLDNFFENTKIPNPLYFTSHYYTRFDTLTQTFEVDDSLPHNDLFKPNPSKIPLYFKESDTSMIKASLGTLDRRVITADIYKVNLSPESFVAPSTAFYCQPISVPEEYKKEYRSAYTAKMWVSELNSAYFIYNPAGNRELEKFQELRFAKLREIASIQSPDKAFERYYTYMPTNPEYKRIAELSKKITADAEAPIDKILAIRDYFLSKDEFNQPLFSYSDNPGVPGIPSASKLNYFLFENRKGYCAYYAGATLFMLRSLGIPSRLAAGFLATDRSSKNPGWYWFYADQAHAWVQVYFQGYGWIDFDTTVPDVNTRQAPQPDGTPPSEVPATYLVMDGEVTAIDTIKKTLKLSTTKMLYHDTEFVAPANREVLSDVSLARIINDTGTVSLGFVKTGTRVTLVSRAEVLKTIYTRPSDTFDKVLERLPAPVPVDEVKVLVKPEQKQKKEEKQEKSTQPVNWLNILYTTLITLVILTCIVFLLPFLIWLYIRFLAQSKNNATERKAFFRHRALLYYLNQMGYSAYGMGPQSFAQRMDKTMGTELERFMSVYQKLKYGTQPLLPQETNQIETAFSSNLKRIKKFIPLTKRVGAFFSVGRTLQFFIKPR